MEEYLEIVNEKDEVVGKETREKIHREGLLHREIHVWFITPNKEIIFQHRAKDKDTYPDLLDATVGGHVEIGMSYDETALKEMEEETGVKAKIEDLQILRKVQKRSEDQATGRVNNAFKVQYVYIYTGRVEDLKVEAGKSLGFELWPIQKLFNLNEEERRRFIPTFLEPEFLNMFDNLK